jgi:hypothetical protein
VLIRCRNRIGPATDWTSGIDRENPDDNIGVADAFTIPPVETREPKTTA